MKKTLLILSLFSTLSLSGYVNLSVAENHKQQVVLTKLSVEEMVNISGTGCSFWDFLGGLIKVYKCSTGDYFACAEVALKLVECGSGFFGGGGGGGGGGTPCTDNCPNGGGAEPSWACSQQGGYNTGTPQCPSSQTDMVCCSYE